MAEGSCVPRGSIVVPFWGSYLESYKAIPKRNYYGASGYLAFLKVLWGLILIPSSLQVRLAGALGGNRGSEVWLQWVVLASSAPPPPRILRAGGS